MHIRPPACWEAGVSMDSLAFFSVLTYKTWLAMPSILKQNLMIGNWDTVGLISWLGEVGAANTCHGQE